MATKNGGSFVRDGNKPPHPVQQQQSQSSDNPQPEASDYPKSVQAKARKRLQEARQRK